MKKLAIKKEQAYSNEGVMLCDNFHFSCMPMEITSNEMAAAYELMGYKIVDVADAVFDDLLKGFSDMIKFQLTIAGLYK